MPLLWLSIAFVTGILLADIAALPTQTWLILAAVCLLVAIITGMVKRRLDRDALLSALPIPTAIKPPLPLPVILLILFLGAARYQASLPDLSDPHFIAAYNDRDTRYDVTGVVVDFPDRRDSFTYLRVQTEEIRPNHKRTKTDVHGLLLARIPPEESFHYGDRILLRGQLETPSENEAFSYRDYLARQGVYSIMDSTGVALLGTGAGNPLMRGIFALKERALDTVYRLWPDPEASLFAGILLGIETSIPQHVKEDFKVTGTSHVIAISGFNITIVAGLFANFFGRMLNPRRGALAAVIGIAIYTTLVGADAAVVRAAIMGGLSLFARQVGRRQHGINTLAFTAALMSLHNPHTPWDIGFQLSFAATLGLILYADPLSQAFVKFASRHIPTERAQRLAGPVGEYILFTLAAQITTLPIMAYHFGSISLTAFLANPVILPVQPPIMTLGGLALILGLFWLPLGKLAAPLAWPFVLFTIRAVEVFGRFRRGVLNLGELSLLWVILFYALLLGLTLAGSRFRERLSGLKPVPVLAVLGVATVVTWRAALCAPDGRLHLTMLDIGSGDALLIRTPGGRSLLVDGGPSTSLLSDGLGRRLPPFRRQLDWLVVAFPQGKNLASLPRLLDRFPPDQVIWAGPESTTRSVDYLRADLIEREIPVTAAEPGHCLDLDAGASLCFLTVGKRGAILLLAWDHFRAMLPVGAAADDFHALNMGADVGPVNVLMLAESGYAPLLHPEWLANLNPQVVLLSVAPDDPSGLPHRETLDILGGYSLLRTDQHGWVHLTTDGKRMWVGIEK